MVELLLPDVDFSFVEEPNVVLYYNITHSYVIITVVYSSFSTNIFIQSLALFFNFPLHAC